MQSVSYAKVSVHVCVLIRCRRKENHASKRNVREKRFGLSYVRVFSRDFFFFFQFILRYLSIDVLWIYDLDTYLDLHTLLFTKKNNLERHVLRRKIWPINDYTYSLHNVFLSFNILYYDTSQLSWYRFIIWTQITKYTITHVYPNNTGKHITVSRQRLWRKRDFRESGRADSRLVRRSEWETVTKRLGLKY